MHGAHACLSTSVPYHSTAEQALAIGFPKESDKKVIYWCSLNSCDCMASYRPCVNVVSRVCIKRVLEEQLFTLQRRASRAAAAVSVRNISVTFP